MIAASPGTRQPRCVAAAAVAACEHQFREAPHAGRPRHDARIRRSRESTQEALLNEPNAVPLIVLSAARDPVEAINSLLRRAGQPAHCTWIPALRDLGDALAQLNPELLIHAAESNEELEASIAVRERTLTDALKSADSARAQLEALLQRSNDAIIQVQEGIVIDANPAWLELSGLEDGPIGQPVMDLFEEPTHAALRGALAACLQGRWSDHPLRANALLADGTVLPVEISLVLGEYEGEP